MPAKDKIALLKALLERLEKDLAVLVQATKTAHEAATHEESKAEDQYDTRGLEAGYLASAQAARAKDLEGAIRALRENPLKEFGPKDAVAVGALVELSQDDEHTLWVFLQGAGAGLNLKLGAREVAVISPLSPLGSELVGRKVGDVFSLKIKNQEKDYEILSAQ